MINALVTFFLIVLFARVVLSWIRLPYNQIIHIIYQVTEPILAPVRRRLPLTWGIDFSPMVVFLVLIAFQMIVVTSLVEYVAIWKRQYMQGV